MLPLLGNWEGTGSGSYPTIEPFEYIEEVSFTHLGKPFILYSQTTQKADKSEYLHSEQGYLRPTADGKLEAIIAQSIGITEISSGVIEKNQSLFQLTSTEVKLSPTAKKVSEIKREIQIDDDHLSYTLSMAAMEQEMTPHLTAELKRVKSL